MPAKPKVGKTLAAKIYRARCPKRGKPTMTYREIQDRYDITSTTALRIVSGKHPNSPIHEKWKRKQYRIKAKQKKESEGGKK